MSAIHRWTRDRAAQVFVLSTSLPLLFLTGWLSTRAPLAAVGLAIAVAGLGLTALEPVAIPLLAIPLLTVVLRVEAVEVALSVSDFALAAASVVAVIFAPRPYSPTLRSILWLVAAYQASTLFAVLNNPYAANTVEWIHVWVLLGGGLLVGWIVGREGHARLGVSLLAAGITLVALGALVTATIQYSRGDFGPVYPELPYKMHKNFAGTLCGMGAAIAYVRPAWLGWSRRTSLAIFAINSLAMMVTQSRQAVIGLVAVVILVLLRSDATRKRSKLILLLLVPALVVVSNLVQDQLQDGNRFNSVFQRLTWFEDSFMVWLTDPWFGVGLRWWYTDRFAVSFQPPNAEVEVLVSAGIVGLMGFMLLILGTMRILLRGSAPYVMLGLAVLVERVVQSQFDLFWAAVQGSLPWVLIGLGLGQQAFQQVKATPEGVEEVETAQRAASHA